MKTIKISLFVIVTLTIGYFVYSSIDCCKLPEALRFSQECNCEEAVKVEASGNVYFDQVKQQIQQLKTDSRVSFQRDAFLVIEHLINNHAQSSYITTAQKNILYADLFRTYVEGFTEYSMKIFRNTEWKIEDLTHIRKESQDLLKSPQIKEGPVRSGLEKITSILSIYDRANAIVSRAKSYSPPMNMQESFHSNGMVDNMSTASKTLQHNEYLKNCTRVINALRDIPNILYHKHFNYLKSKIKGFAANYKDYPSQPIYNSSVYKPLKAELDTFYTSNEFPDTHAKYKVLEEDLDRYNNQAFSHYNPD